MMNGLKMKSHTAIRIGAPLSNERGIALLLTLVVLVLLTAVIIEFDYGAKVNLITAGNFRDDIQATYLAKSGVAAARAVLKDDAMHHGASDDLNELWARPFPPYPVGEGFVSVEITDEAGKIDINRLGAQAPNVRQATQQMLKRLLRVLEIEANEIDPIVEAIKNWVDPDVSHNCVEDAYYQRFDPPYRCKKGPMDSLSELLLVKGVTPEIYRKIRPYLTTVSAQNQPPININTADLPVLEALHDDISRDVAICMQGNRPYENISDQFFGCGLAKAACTAASSCQGQIGVKSNYFTVKAHGIMHETDKIVTALIQRDVNKIISWWIE